MITRILNLLDWCISHTVNLITGLFLAALAYFANLKGAIHVMWAAFVLDFIFGYITSRKLRKEKFSMNKAFIMLERMLIASAVILLLFAIDKETGQDYIHLYNIMAWLISGMLCYSFLDNGDKLTGGKFFGAIKTLLTNKIKEQTGVELEHGDDEMMR